MSTGNSSHPAALHNQTTEQQSHISAPEGRILVEFGSLKEAPNLLRAFLRGRVFDVMHEKRLPNFKRHDVLLKRIVLNDHSPDHVDQVTYMALQVGRAFPDKFNPQALEAAVVGGMVHDVAFMEAAEAWVIENIQHEQADVRTQVENLDTGLKLLRQDRLAEAEELWSVHLPPTHPHLGKKQLDPHTVHGENLLKQWMDDAGMDGVFGHWTQSQRSIATETVLQHSNGSGYVASEVPLAAKLVRLTDKLHNTRGRSEHLLDANLLTDPRNIHQFVPAAIEDMALEIDDATHTITAVYMVDPGYVERRMREFDTDFTYDRDRFLGEMHVAYDKAFGLAAEVVATLFAADGEVYAKDAHLNICCEFKDRSESVTHAYAPFVAASH